MQAFLYYRTDATATPAIIFTVISTITIILVVLLQLLILLLIKLVMQTKRFTQEPNTSRARFHVRIRRLAIRPEVVRHAVRGRQPMVVTESYC